MSATPGANRARARVGGSQDSGGGTRYGWSFLAGAVAVLTAHQAVLWALHARGLAPWPAYSRAPTRPLGVPAVASAAFWGGVWGVPLALALRGARSPAAYWGRAALFGAVAPNAVGALLIALGHAARPRAGAALAAAASAVLVNGSWALAAAALLRALPGAAGGAPGVRRPTRDT